jgi:hypothetical protein
MPVLPFETRLMGRTVRAALALLAPLLFVTCTENPAGPDRPGLGTLRVAPRFDAFARIPPLTLDNVQIIVVRPRGDTLANVSRGFSVTNQQLSLNVPILMSGLTDDVDVTLRLFAGTTLLFEGTSLVQVTAGAANQPNPIPVSYQGPGSSVASLVLSPRDTTLQAGDSLAFQLSAADSQQSPVAQYYVSWSLVGVTATGASLDATGKLHAPGSADLFYVKVATPNGTVDSTSVTIVPRVQPGLVTWTGAVDSQWSTGGNWNGGKPPSAVDSVLIPATNNDPVLTANAVAGAVNVTGGNLTLNGDTLTVARGFATTGTGTLTMLNPTDLLAVGGNARFAGGSTAGQLTAGRMTVGGTFTQLAGTSSQSFSADSNHVTELDASTPVISFATPGLTTSHFAYLEQGFNGTDFQFATDVAVARNINSQQDGFSGSLRGSNVALTVSLISSMRLDGVRLILDNPDSTQFTGVFSVQFTNLPTSATQVTVRHPGFGSSPFAMSGVSFVPLAGGNTGSYISAVDVDGVTPVPLIVYVDFDASGNGPSFTQTSGGAQVFWPSTPVVWTGVTNSDWGTATNWNSLRQPFANNVVIPSGTPNSPQLLGFGAGQASLTVQPGATLDLGSNGFSVSGAIDAGGQINGTLQGSLTGGGTARGNINVPLTLTGSLNGRLTLGGGAGLTVNGNLDLAGHTLDVSGSLVVNGLSSLTMTNSLDSLLVAGSASMCGGTFSAGVAKVGGNFATCLSANAYSPSGAHKTVLGGASPRTITITTLGGTPTGSFHILDVSGATGGLQLLSGVIVDSLLISTPAVGTPSLFGGGNTLSTRRVQVSRMLIDQVPMTIDELGTALPQQFDNVTFQNDTTSTLLSLSMVGAALAPRTVTFNGWTLSFNGSNSYVQLVSSNGLGVTVVVNGSNNPTGGPSRSIPSFGSTVNGARVLWQ